MKERIAPSPSTGASPSASRRPRSTISERVGAPSSIVHRGVSVCVQEAALDHLRKEHAQVAFQPLRLDLELFEHRRPHALEAVLLGQELPDPRPDGVEPVIHAGGEVQQHGLLVEHGEQDVAGYPR
jgi:hypothetical protein